MRGVLDTNVIISALFWGGGPRRVVDLAVSGYFQAITSQELLAELEAVLVEDFGVPPERLDMILRDILSYAEVVLPTEKAAFSVRDVADVKVIECAVAGEADFIITGDKDLLDLGKVKAIQIVTVREFLEAHA
jgi:hypothetical protein